MNLFTGMTHNEIISSIVAFILFNGYVVLAVIALTAFYLSSRPRRGRVRTAAVWHLVALVWFLLAFISTVWSAPAEKSFVDDGGDLVWNGTWLGAARFQKVVIGLGFAAAGVLCVAIGLRRGGQQKREWARQATLQDAPAQGVAVPVPRG